MLRGSTPARSTLASVNQTIVLLDDATEEPIDLRQFEDIIVTVSSSMYPDDYAYGGRELQFSLQNGDIVMEPDGLACHFVAPRSMMQNLAAKTYDIGVRFVLEDDDNEFQMMLGKLPIVKGL